jgi:hypothetical protein
MRAIIWHNHGYYQLYTIWGPLVHKTGLHSRAGAIVNWFGVKTRLNLRKRLNQNVLDYLHRHFHLAKCMFYGLTLSHYPNFLKVKLMRAIIWHNHGYYQLFTIMGPLVHKTGLHSRAGAIVNWFGVKTRLNLRKRLNQNVLDYLHRHFHLAKCMFYGLTLSHYPNFLKVNLMRAIISHNHGYYQLYTIWGPLVHKTGLHSRTGAIVNWFGVKTRLNLRKKLNQNVLDYTVHMKSKTAVLDCLSQSLWKCCLSQSDWSCLSQSGWSCLSQSG